MDQHSLLEFIYLASIIVSIGITVGVGIYAIRRRQVPGARSFAHAIFLEAAWTTGYFIGMISPTLENKIFWDNIQWIAVVFLPLTILAFARKFADPQFKSSLGMWFGFSIIPLVTVVFLFTNPLHGLAVTSIQLIPAEPFPIYTYNFGPVLWAGVIYALIITGMAIITLANYALRQQGIFQIQAWVIILGFAIPTLGSIVGMAFLFLIPSRNIDISPYTFAIANLCIAYGLFHYGLFEIVPFARTQIMEKMEDGVMVLDRLGRLLDINPAAKNMVGMLEKPTIGQPLTRLLPPGLEQLALDPDVSSGHTEITLDSAGTLKVLDLGITRLINQRGDFSGHMLILRDITARRQLEDEMRRDQDLLEQRVNERTLDLQTVNENLKTEVDQRRRAELEKETQRSEMEILYRLTVELAAMPVDGDLEGMITTRLKQLTGAFIVALTEYNPLKKHLELRGLEMDNRVMREITSLLGRSFTQLTYPVSDAMYAEMVNNVVTYRQTANEVTLGVIPPAASVILQKIFDVKLFVGMVAQFQGELMGSFILVLQNSQTVPSEWLLNALANVLSIIYRRKWAEAARLESEKRFHNLAELLPQPIFESDLSGQITYANQIGLQMFGYPRSAAGLSFMNMVVETQRQQVVHEMQQIVEGQAVTPKEFLALRQDGSTFPVLVYTGPIIQDNHVVGLRGIVVDISEPKQHEHELEVIVTMSQALRSAETSTKLLLMIYNQVVDLLHVDFGTLELIDRASGDAEAIYSYGLETPPDARRTPKDKGLDRYIRASKKPYVDNNLAENPLALGALVSNGCTAIAGVPMIAEDELIGFIWIGRKAAISEAEVHLLAAIADIAASSVRRMTLHELTEKQLNRLGSLRKIDATINSGKDLVMTLSVLLEQTQIQLKADATDVLLCNADFTILQHQFGQGFTTDAFTRHTIRMGEGPAGLAVQNKQLVQIRNLAELGPDHRLVKASQKEGFVSYFAVPLMAQTEIKGVLEVFFRKEFIPDNDWIDFLETLAGQAAIAIEQVQLFTGLQRSNQELVRSYDETIEGWVKALDLRDKETEGHSLRVTRLCVELAARMGIKESELIHVRRGALLHDIGKMGIPDYILLKNGPLTDEEWVIMRQHPIYAQQMLSGIDYLVPAIQIPLSHHEWWDGSGYPYGLRGTDIPLEARIFAIVDVWDALISDRPYRQAWPAEKVRAYIAEKSGSQFDPQVVTTFLADLD